jgi:DnaJ homologue, subfamily C, member 28, conserved domain
MLDFLVEQRLEEAVSRGELTNLPGEGRPLDLDDDALIPEDLRLAHRILKNAGFVPPEVQMLRDIAQLETVVNGQGEDSASRARAVKRLALLRTRIESSYYEKAVAKLGR